MSKTAVNVALFDKIIGHIKVDTDHIKNMIKTYNNHYRIAFFPNRLELEAPPSIEIRCVAIDLVLEKWNTTNPVFPNINVFRLVDPKQANNLFECEDFYPDQIVTVKPVIYGANYGEY